MRGRCELVDGEIRLQSSTVGYLRRLYEGGKAWFLVTLASLAYGVGAFGYMLWVRDWRLLGFTLGTVALLVLFQRVYGRFRGLTTDDLILLSAVESVEAVPKSNVFSRPRFVVRYRRDGETVRRRVLLPLRSLSYTAETYDRAKGLFRDRGISVEERK